MALAMGRFGYWDNGSYVYLIDDGTGYADYLSALRSYIEKAYAANDGILHSAKATEWHRAVVAIAALGGDPEHFGMYNDLPIDLIADGSYNSQLKAGPGTQGLNGWIWGLIAMDTGMYKVPEDAKYTRETFITEILKMQLTDGVSGNAYGGWVLGGFVSKSDVDMTGMRFRRLLLTTTTTPFILMSMKTARRRFPKRFASAWMKHLMCSEPCRMQTADLFHGDRKASRVFPRSWWLFVRSGSTLQRTHGSFPATEKPCWTACFSSFCRTEVSAIL